MDFALSEEEKAIRDKAREFVQKECLPLESTWPISDYDAPPEVVRHLRKKMTEYGFYGLAVPKEYGGQGKGTLAKCLVFEQFKQSWVLFGGVVATAAHFDPHPSLFSASDYQKEKYLYPTIRGELNFHFCISEPGMGSDVAGMKTRAVKQGDKYIINGLKRWSPDPARKYAGADYFIVYAVTDPGKGHRGISIFLVDAGTPGVRVDKLMETLAPGTTLGTVCDLAFEDCVIPAKNLLGKENEGFRGGMTQLNRNRIVIAMGAVGTAQRCLEMATEYAKQRVTFGKPLSERQAIQWMLADSAVEIQLGRLLGYHAAWKLDQGVDARLQSAMAKLYCTSMAARVIDNAIQVHGGIGCLEETRLGKAYMFMRTGGRIAEGSAETMRRVITKCLLNNWPFDL